MKLILTFTLLAIVVAVPVAAQAQFNMPSIPGIGSKASAGASTDLSGSQDQLVKQYVAANKDVLDANSKMADALGLQTQASAARAAGDALNDGATKGNLSDADKASSDTSQSIADAMKNPPAMDAQSKAKYASGMVSLAKGVMKYVGMKGAFETFKSGLSSASPMMLPKLQSGAYIAMSFPSNLKSLSSVLSNAVVFAKAHDIAVPDDATKALSAL